MNHHSNLISVGIPTYNQGSFLRATLDSLLLQTCTPLEIVVSNNHSTDNTTEILKEYEGKIRIIHPKEHLDAMPHWNYLVSQLKGDWFTLLSSDDLAKPLFVETLAEGIGRGENSVLVRAGWENMDGEGNFIEKRYMLSVAKHTRPPQTFFENLYGPKTSFAAFAVKKSAWENIGGFPTKTKLYGDWAFWLGLSPLGDFIYEHKIISSYRLNYRPGLDIERLPFEIPDEVLMCSEIIPEISSKFGNIDQSNIKKAAKARFMGKLNYISKLLIEKQLKEEERLEYAEKLFSWSKLVGCEFELQQFKAGKNFVAKANPIKTLLRKIVHLIRS